MAGNEGLRASIKRSAPETETAQRESLAMKELCPELGEVMDTVIKTVNYMKTRLLKNRLLHNYARKLGYSISYSCFSVILIGCQEKKLQLVFTSCEKE
jgi:transcriptional antiterminator